MDTPITRAEHDEFCKRMETENQRLADEDKRLGRRVAVLEDTTRQMQALTTNVERLAVSMENMAKVQAEQASRLLKFAACQKFKSFFVLVHGLCHHFLGQEIIAVWIGF